MSQDLFNRFFWSIVWLQVYLGVSWYKIFHVSYFYIIALFFVIVSVLESGIHCYFIHIFISNFCKFFGKCSFHTHCDVSRTRNILQNYSNFSQISLAKSVNKRFMNITFCCSLFFFQKRFEGMSRNNPTKKQIGAEIQAKLNHAPAQKPAEEKML